MKYHISTSLIIQEFPKHESECPMCEIRSIVEKNITEQYLGEAVMSLTARKEVNEKGFCEGHFDMLFAGQSKLGLALQCITRMNVLKAQLSPGASVRSAKKSAVNLAKMAKTCVICDAVSDHMTRYAKTVAELYLSEPDFRELLPLTKGFCLPHYAELVDNSSYAGIKAKEYVNVLADIEKQNLERVQADLQWFCDRHDFRNAGKPLGASEDALPRTRIKLYGKKSK